ncbi:MAG: GAF domain-containing protein, partial [Anaerolineae bacterium]|nr:GAF domain-containing protein [Anaerolineae bacterium]
TAIDVSLLTPLYAHEITYIEAPINRVESLVSAAPVKVNAGGISLDELGWVVVTHQGQREVVALATAQARSILIPVALLALGMIVAGVGFSHLLISPITGLIEAARQITLGDLSVRAPVKTRDEIGVLAEAFNLMTSRLRDTIDSLEERVSERTRQLETVVIISQSLGSILDLSDLLRQMVVLVKERFDYYHVHIYLLDERGDTLTMTEGYGRPGAEMKRLGHSIPLSAPRSLVAEAARSGQVVTVGDVRENPHWLPNNWLPKTRSEMAVPVTSNGRLIGVLDVQSDRVDDLTEEDETALKILANQIAIAVRNANLFSETQDKLYEAERLQRLYTSNSWQALSQHRATTDYEVRQSADLPLRKVDTPEVDYVLNFKQTLTDASAISWKDSDSHHTVLATPLKLRDQVIGVLGLHDEDSNRRWTDDEIALIEAVSEQMSLAVENARLFEETGRQAHREKIIADMTQKIWSSAQLEQVMKTAVEQLGTNFDASKVVIKLKTQSQSDQETPLGANDDA